MVITIGFTGTRNGMTQRCKAVVVQMIARLIGRYGIENLVGVHGDCLGADADFDTICKDYEIERHRRPCTMKGEADHPFRAHTDAKVIAEPTNPMARNREIAKSDIIIGCPPTKHELHKGSGTWATIRYGKRYGKPVYVIAPDGTWRMYSDGPIPEAA